MSRFVRSLSITFTRPELLAVGLLLAMAAVLLSFQYITLAKFAILPPGLGLATLQEWSVDVPTRVGLSWGDAVLSLSMVGITFGLASLEWGRSTKKAFSAD